VSKQAVFRTWDIRNFGVAGIVPVGYYSLKFWGHNPLRRTGLCAQSCH